VWRRWIFAITATIVVVLDQISKSWIRANVLPGGIFLRVDRLTLLHTQNTGSAFGLFPDQTLMLTIVAIVGLVLIVVLFRQLPHSLLASLALGLVFGGAIGNLTDRIRLGFVTDFIDVLLWGDYHWPAFNVADSSITIGTIALAIFILTGLKKEHGQPSQPKNHSS
jgi:signal peptidase II